MANATWVRPASGAMIRKLQIMRNMVRAEVRIGENEWGAGVYVTVELKRTADDVTEALAPVERLLSEAAAAHLAKAANAQQAREIANAEMGKRLKPEIERLRRDTDAEMTGLKRRLDEANRDLTDARKQIVRERDSYAMASGELDSTREVIRQLRQEVSRLQGNTESTTTGKEQSAC